MAAMPQTQTVIDPWDTVNNPPPPPEYKNWGVINVSAWLCMFVPNPAKPGKNMKVPYDAQTLLPDGKSPRRNTAIDLTISPLPGTSKFDTVSQMVAEFGEWPEKVLPSLKQIGITNVQSINGKWCRFIRGKSDRTYKTDTGETKNAPGAIVFEAIFDTEADCQADHDAITSGGAAPTPAQPPADNNGNERATALKFLKPYVHNAWAKTGDLDKARVELAPMLAGQVLLSKYFTVDSPEVLDLLAQEATSK